MAYKIKNKKSNPKEITGWRTEVYEGYLLRFERMKNPKFIGVLAFKGGKPQIVSGGTQQYIGVGKSKREAIADAKSSIDMWKN